MIDSINSDDKRIRHRPLGAKKDRGDKFNKMWCDSCLFVYICFADFIFFFEWLFKRKFYSIVIKPFMLAFPGATIACYKIDVVHNAIPQTIVKTVDEYIWVVIVLYFALPVFVGLEEIIKHQARKFNQKNLTTDSYALFIRALDYPVNKKMDRFLSILTEDAGKRVRSGDVFKKITQPDVQLAEIIRSIHIFFEGLAQLFELKEIELQTTLFQVNDEIPSASWCYQPLPL